MKKLYNQVTRSEWHESEYAMPVIARYGTGGGNVPIIVQTYKQYRYGIYVPSDHSATIRAESGKLDGGGGEALILYEADDIQSDQPKRRIQSE